MVEIVVRTEVAESVGAAVQTVGHVDAAMLASLVAWIDQVVDLADSAVVLTRTGRNRAADAVGQVGNALIAVPIVLNKVGVVDAELARG